MIICSCSTLNSRSREATNWDHFDLEGVFKGLYDGLGRPGLRFTHICAPFGAVGLVSFEVTKTAA